MTVPADLFIDGHWRPGSDGRRFDVIDPAELMVRENGKSWADAIGEATYAKELFRWFAEEAV